MTRQRLDIYFIYMPYNIGRCHWILIVLDMVEGRINVWGSFIDLTSEADLDKECDNMRCVVSTLLHRHGVFTVKPNLLQHRGQYIMYKMHPTNDGG
ncbi:hypothetical protein E5676_scaffold110G00160 [Cucumis melo var. makuwa]|uniref:Ubiquitin-like protease family profile domain-containing protein n=1 Tax=Cucumis melo var. makuwa TaxID=1194695 RepID=A0A5A7VD70_CUCMM|nr:hypothetical protein E6C27_scaffold977G00570 [Cucumis melo var. makuwa]TYJ95757.1 hypothetical protein E5676_scaffold110G00160 [Cucumis melo var. makuwa]